MTHRFRNRANGLGRTPSASHFFFLSQGVFMVALFYLGALLCVVGGLWLLVVAFTESILWGLASLFIPFVILIFALTHWERSQKPFLIYLAGAILCGIGYSAVKAQVPVAG
jgi:hypothetical protein